MPETRTKPLGGLLLRFRVRRFLKESNRIEGIKGVTEADLDAAENFMSLDELTVDSVCTFVSATQPGAKLRDQAGMDVRVGDHRPMPGGPMVPMGLSGILYSVNTDEESPYENHQLYERLHPFMDGNGRSGRMIWLWQMVMHHSYTLNRLFLHEWYYQSLSGESRGEQ